MIIGKAKLFQNGCRMRYCVARILLQNKKSFFGDGLTLVSAMRDRRSQSEKKTMKETNEWLCFF